MDHGAASPGVRCGEKVCQTQIKTIRSIECPNVPKSEMFDLVGTMKGKQKCQRLFVFVCIHLYVYVRAPTNLHINLSLKNLLSSS